VCFVQVTCSLTALQGGRRTVLARIAGKEIPGSRTNFTAVCPSAFVLNSAGWCVISLCQLTVSS
jgi:hypothetical protein